MTHCFNDEHIAAAKHLLRYLRTTKDLQLVYKREPNTTERSPKMWVDADFCPDYGDWADNYRSTTAWLAISNGTAISWNSVRQQRLAQSSTESEYYAAAEAVKEAARIRALHHDLGYRTGPITVYEDNQSCIKQAENPCDREAQKHIDLRAHYLREQVHANNVKMIYVSTGEQIADGLSKNLPRPEFEKYRKSIDYIYHGLDIHMNGTTSKGSVIHFTTFRVGGCVGWTGSTRLDRQPRQPHTALDTRYAPLRIQILDTPHSRLAAIGGSYPHHCAY